MRIVRGKFRHRVLQTNPGLTTRPITVRVKISLFERLQGYLEDARVADIYAGTGTLGLEALSRGAKSVVFIEGDWNAAELLKENIASLNVSENTLCWRTDVTKCSFRPKDSAGFLPYDVIFFDPPYVHAERLKAGTMLFRSLQRLAKPEISAPSAKLIFRCATGTKFDVPPIWQPEELFEYSSMDVHVFTKTAAADDQEKPEKDDSIPATE